MKTDAISGLLIVGMVIFVAWCVRGALRSGRWRLRGGTVYRDKSPTLFWGATTLALGMSVFASYMVLMMLNHDIACGGQGTPGHCMAKSFHALVGRAQLLHIPL